MGPGLMAWVGKEVFFFFAFLGVTGALDETDLVETFLFCLLTTFVLPFFNDIFCTLEVTVLLVPNPFPTGLMFLPDLVLTIVSSK